MRIPSPTALPAPTVLPAQGRVAFPLPEDPALPALPDLLDGARFAAWAESVLGLATEEWTPRFLRYKPGKRAVVLHEVSVSSRQTWAVVTIAAGKDLRSIASSPEARRVADAARARCASPEPVHAIDEIGALVEWYPARLDLPGLVTAPGRARALGRTVAVEEPELIVYRPLQRAVLRANGL